jgi:hypothetical protein
MFSFVAGLEVPIPTLPALANIFPGATLRVELPSEKGIEAVLPGVP